MTTEQGNVVMRRIWGLMVSSDVFQSRYPRSTTDKLVMHSMMLIIGKEYDHSLSNANRFYNTYEAVEQDYEKMVNIIKYLKEVTIEPVMKLGIYFPIIAEMASIAIEKGMTSSTFSNKLNQFFKKDSKEYVEYRKYCDVAVAKYANVKGRSDTLKKFMFN